MSEDSSFFDPHRTNTVRSVVLYSLGALIGLGIAGYGLFTAQGTSTRTVPPENVATINNRPILRSDFITQLMNETGVPFADASRADQLRVLDEMVREELLVQRGMELDFVETDQDTRNALVNSMTQQAVAQVTMSGKPSDDVLMKFFNEHRAEYQTLGALTVRNFYLPIDAAHTAESTLPRAKEAAEALRKQPIDDVVKQFGLKEGDKNEGDWYWVAKIHLGDELFAHVKDLKSGDVAEPLQTKDGIHIVKVLKNDAPVPMTFDDARSQVFSDYDTTFQARLTEETLKFLRGRAKIMIAPDFADYKP